MLGSFDITTPMAQPTAFHRVGMVTTFPPTRCGIARFSASLASALTRIAPDLNIDIVRLIDGRQPSVASNQIRMEIDPDGAMSSRAAARHLNQCDVVVFQHEYGIYGSNDGEAILDMVDLVERPIVVVLHTVVGNPNRNQRRVIESLGERSRLVVLSEAARTALAGRYDIPRSQVVVIPHGAHWPAQPPRPGPRHQLITWGLLGPGKGLERSIGAMPMLRDLEPRPRYRIVGRTHPAVLRAHGPVYRQRLQALVRELGVADMVEFVDRYVEDHELLQMVASSDIVVIPYDNHEQVSSGVLTEAVGAGRPVVATRFPHAVELVEPGAGIVVEHASAAIAAGVRRLLTVPEAYERAVSVAAETSAALAWEAAADRHARLIRSLIWRRATA